MADSTGSQQTVTFKAPWRFLTATAIGAVCFAYEFMNDSSILVTTRFMSAYFEGGQPNTRSGEYELFHIDVATYPSARCLDGSPAGGYIRPSPVGSDVVVVFMQGGGFCDNEESCSRRARDTSDTSLGSSIGWSHSCPPNLCGGVTSTSCLENPDFCNATLIYLRYCSGDHWLGTRSTAISLSTASGSSNASSLRAAKERWFSGSHIIEATIDMLQKTELIRQGTKLLLGGRSMGGIGAFAHADWINGALKPIGVETKAMLGWCVGTRGADFQVPPPEIMSLMRVGWEESGGPHDQACGRTCMQLYQPKMPKMCADSPKFLETLQTPSQCLEAPVEAILRMETPVFIATTPWSAVALGGIPANNFTCKYLSSWGEASKRGISTLQNRGRNVGLFAPSCFRHSVPWSSVVEGVTYQEALGKWFYEGGKVSLVDTCEGVGCSSTCGDAIREGSSLVGPACVLDKMPYRSPAVFSPELSESELCPTDEMKKIYQDYWDTGVLVLPGFFDQHVLDLIQRELEEIVDHYANALAESGSLTSPNPSTILDGLGFDHKYTALFQDMLRATNGKVLLPTYFRKESHKPGIYNFMRYRKFRNLMECLLDTPSLRLYPVYMMRGKVPDHLSEGAMTVDWHQDAEYTFYWYSDLNTTQKDMNTYADGIINTWVPIADVPLELGPVQLVKHSHNYLTRAQMRQSETGVEALRIDQIDQYLAKNPGLAINATMKRGDLLIFTQYTYHRGLPNLSVNKTRWSLDFRFQRSSDSTLRPEVGFELDGDGVASINSAADWEKAQPSLRLSEIREREHNPHIGGNAWGRQHEHAAELLGAAELNHRIDYEHAHVHSRRLSAGPEGGHQVFSRQQLPGHGPHD